MDDTDLKKFYSNEDYFNLLQFAVENSWVGYIIANREGEYLYTNKSYERHTGYAPEIIKGLTAQYIENEGMYDKVSSTMLVLKNKEEVVIEQYEPPINRNILVKGTPYLDKNGDIKYVISQLVDLRAFQEKQQEIRKLREGKGWSQHEKIFVEDSYQDDQNTEFIVYKSKVMCTVMDQARTVAKSDATVFLLGETGTGKEMMAQYIHQTSFRKDMPFVRINCSAIPENLLESELFGYEPGSFTGGAREGKIGLLEFANNGTVLLDEIGDMPLSLQSKILRVLQEKEITKIGGRTPIKINVRFIASTNADIVELVSEKRFRRDLYYRLSVMPINLPPLRERKEDIALLVHYFVKKYNRKYGMNKTIDWHLIEIVMKKPFYGNVRQLANLIERLIIMSPDNKISVDIFEKLYFEHDDIAATKNINIIADYEDKPLKQIMEEYEKYILQVYRKRYKSTYRISEKLKTNQSTIFRKLQKYRID
jgi:PAS domain S-box-containing protein